MKKRIWIWNHYATNMFKNSGRHDMFAQKLLEKGYEPIIFCASTTHNSDQNIVRRELYLEKKKHLITYVFIKTPSYSGNGKKRIFNILTFYKNLKIVAEKYAKENGKPDVIYASSAHPLTLVAAIKVSKKMRVENICEIRDLWPESFVSYGILNEKNILTKLLYKGEKWIYKKADKLIFTMEGGRDYLIEKGWNNKTIDLNKIYYINNGVDLKKFEQNANDYTIKDENLENKENYKVVYTGSLRKANDSVWKLVKAAEILNRKEPEANIKIFIYGDGSERKNIEKYCKENRVENVDIKGRVEKKFIPYILKCCDLNVLNCSDWTVLKYGGSQNKLFEYLASGNPTISGESSKYNILRKYKCGTARTFIDEEDIANEILLYYKMDEKSLKNLKENIKETVKEFDYSNLTDKLLKVIEG